MTNGTDVKAHRVTAKVVSATPGVVATFRGVALGTGADACLSLTCKSILDSYSKGPEAEFLL